MRRFVKELGHRSLFTHATFCEGVGSQEFIHPCDVL